MTTPAPTQQPRPCRDRTRRIVEQAVIPAFAQRFPEQVDHAVEVVLDGVRGRGAECTDGTRC